MMALINNMQNHQLRRISVTGIHHSENGFRWRSSPKRKCCSYCKHEEKENSRWWGIWRSSCFCCCSSCDGKAVFRAQRGLRDIRQEVGFGFRLLIYIDSVNELRFLLLDPQSL
ncbi:hypothetical protein P8452_35848 [Trifolium repens]|nr:hypothetical protein P8452_35848 [Trifolium repens]